ncbi:ABC transporter substrate-binding protein [Oceanicella actignis]|uniref:Polar amino acid transport system substrate-binding protein n=1 Tax=Oceanicella actignis TaxID=1189325 RepID=A0A1M7T8E6_9RHOB|nr:transporter substrate-binding domain-containing protein [Oceanicella actignis]TYO89080.1 polar amino acid transport system substrate-binding protein [Oceanicella actignis]SET49407.1 amino acid ABC transporter substrate-binding protein, PAAT family (TC 3.A.1.3.-) [Oceanicella actignis]SHN66966.1 polar amino acid transport system substrate-binding protein [Oceanicella actignis]
MKRTFVMAGALALAALTMPAKADKLDDIIASGTLRCAVVLDFPPMGFRDENNQPVGFDVDYCRDLAKALGVEAEIVETTFPERIPALMSGRVDVAVASTSDTLERAKTVGFTIPYYAFENAVVANEKSGIESWEDMKGKTIGATAGTYEAIWIEGRLKEWGAGEFRPYQNQADVFLALSQGQIDATVSTVEVAEANVKSGKFPGIRIVDKAPMVPDYVGLITLREEYGLINYMNLFINQQVRTGRYQELYRKWVGDGEPADLTVKGVYR